MVSVTQGGNMKPEVATPLRRIYTFFTFQSILNTLKLPFTSLRSYLKRQIRYLLISLTMKYLFLILLQNTHFLYTISL